jgi:hypothetical protein
VERPPAEPPDHELRLAEQVAADVGGMEPVGTRADRQPGGTLVLGLDGEQVADDRRRREAGRSVKELGSGSAAAELVAFAGRVSRGGCGHRRGGGGRPQVVGWTAMSPMLIWMQGAIVVCVLVAMVIAIVKLS